jgi:hypothetical protein
MASAKGTNGNDTGIVSDFNEVLQGCQMSARGFFFALLPLFEASHSYGFLEMDTEQLSKHFHLSLHHTRRYLYELKRKHILRVSHDGTLICPVLIRQHYKVGGTA